MENCKKLTWKFQNSQNVSPPFKVGSVEQSPKQAAGAFDNYFLNVIENLIIHIPKDNLISLLKNY